MKQKKMIGNKMRRIAAILAAAFATMFATSAARATDLEDFYFRHDFSSGTRVFSKGVSSTLTEDKLDSPSDATAVYGPDGANTAFHPRSAWGQPFGSNNSSSKLNSNWSVAASVRAPAVEGGVLFSLGRMSAKSLKEVALCSSTTNGKLYLKVLKRDSSNTKSVDKNTSFTVDDTTNKFHAVVLVYTATATAGKGTFTLYFDGEKLGDLEVTSTEPFGNGFQYSTLLSISATADYTTLGCVNVSGNSALAFQDMRVFTSALTAEDAAAYAALYPVTLPGFSNLDQYAYVQSYGVNGVDTGYNATDSTKFVVDFEFTDVSRKSWLMGASESGLSQTHAIYLNGSKQLAWTTRGQHWVAKWPSSNITGASIENVRLVENILSTGTARDKVTASVTWYNARTTMNSKLSNSGNNNSLTTKGPSTVTTHLFRGNGIMDNDTQACNAKIYSFEVDDDCTSGLPAAFFAPTMDANGAAGFTNVVAGTFHGECQSSPPTALTFTSGVGRAEDYRYRSGKFYSRIYATSSDATKGLVKFDGGEAAGTNAQFTARGRTAKIIAVPAEYYAIDRWEGDTWAIVSGYNVTDATIEVKSDTAIQLRAVFKYMRVATPALGDDVSVMFSGSTTIALSCATEGASLYYTLDGTKPTESSTPYEGSAFSISPTTTKTTLKVIAVKDGWYDSEVFEVVLVNLAVAPTSAYVQSGRENLLLHLDAIENAGAGTHSDSPETWADLTGNHAVTNKNSATFSEDAFVANKSSYFLTASDSVTNAFSGNTKFTLELVISHPAQTATYENWVYAGLTTSREILVEIRPGRSSNPLVQTVQYRFTGFHDRAALGTSSVTKWDKRQHITVVCDGDTAKTYCNGKDEIHSVTADSGMTPSSTDVAIGASPTGTNPLLADAEVCAVRMTNRILNEDERMCNFYVDSQRFGLADAPTGYRIADGKVQVLISDGVEGFEFSTDGGATWAAGEVWVDINTEVTLSARVAASTELPVTFKNLPGGATVSGNNVTFTPTKPCAITVSAAQWSNNDNTGSFDTADNWIGGVLPSEGNDFTVNISGDTVITVNEAYTLGVMTVKGAGNVTFAGTGSISAMMLNVDPA